MEQTSSLEWQVSINIYGQGGKSILLVPNRHKRFKWCNEYKKKMFGLYGASLSQSVKHHRKSK